MKKKSSVQAFFVGLMMVVWDVVVVLVTAPFRVPVFLYRKVRGKR